MGGGAALVAAIFVAVVVAVIASTVVPTAPAAAAAGDPQAPLPRPTHVVARGEALAEIASMHGVSVADLRRWNDLRGDDLRPGQRLYVAPPSGPAGGGEERAVAGATAVPTDPALAGESPFEEPMFGDPAPGVAGSSAVPSLHVVEPGETLDTISSAQGVPVTTIKDLNQLEGERVYAGQILRLREPAGGEGSAPETDEGPSYIVQRGDDLPRIAERFGVSRRLLRRLNDLPSETVRPGQKLRLRPSAGDLGVHVVGPGETLSEIAARYGVDVAALCEINGIDRNRIFVGQALRLRSTPPETYVVQPGDALGEIAVAFGTTVSEIKRTNGLASSRIYPGQELQLSRSRAERFDTYTVRRGDSLSEIAQLHRMTLAEIGRVNDLPGSIIHPGQTLKVRPIRGEDETLATLASAREVDWDDLGVTVPGLRLIRADNGPYYGHRPRAERQTDRGYLEEGPVAPREAHRRATRLLAAFDERVEKLGMLSNRLKGWTIVIDPGHGGIDPGTITRTVDGRGDPVYVVEDEYVYDISLRMYALFRLHGADVKLTILSPNHLIRESIPATQTFVHQRDEVFADPGFSGKNGNGSWPRGGQAGLSERVRIAKEAFQDVPRNRRIFLSIHADNSPSTPNVPLVLYYANSRRTDLESRRFGESLLSALGAGAQIRGQRLEVLRDNPAAVKVLIEVRNMCYPDHAWALRYPELRQRDAEKVVQGVLDWVASR